MLVNYPDSNGQIITTLIESPKDYLSNYIDGNNTTPLDRLELFTLGYYGSEEELHAVTQWAREATGIEELIGLACSSDDVYKYSRNTVIYDGIGGVNQFLQDVQSEEIFDHYPIKNVNDAITYQNLKNEAIEMIKKNY